MSKAIAKLTIKMMSADDVHVTQRGEDAEALFMAATAVATIILNSSNGSRTKADVFARTAMAALQTVEAAVLTAAKATAIHIAEQPAQATVIVVAMDAQEAVLAAVHLALDSCGNEKGRTKWTWHLNRTTTQEAKRRIPKIFRC